MFCEKCGTQLNEGSEFCSKCGTKVGLSVEAQGIENQKSENKQAITQVAVIPSGTAPLVMGLLGLFGGFIPVVKYVTGLLSLLAIFIGVSQKKKLKGAGLPTGKATAGIVLGAIAVLITVITIAFSAMIIGSLFSGNKTRSGNNRSSGLFVNRTLPTGIQNTIWSNGDVNIEFGKNKVKLNDEWYPVKGIATSNTGSFTWVYFSDDYVITLQHRLNNELKLTGLRHENARIEDGIGGFMTPAEMEADRIEKERIAREITGVWEGSYSLGGYYGFKADMTLDIVNQNGKFQAVLNFNVTNISGGMFGAPFPINTKGSCELDMSYYSNGEYYFEFKKWIVQPNRFERINFQGTVTGNALSGDIDGGIDPVPFRGSFNVARKN